MAVSHLPSAPPLHQVVYPRPETRWDILDPIESSTQTLCRRMGKLFVGVGFAAGIGRYVAARRLRGTPDFIINTCFTLGIVAVGALVSGTALWFFNRLGVAPEELLKSRKEIGAKIDNQPLATLYDKDSPWVFSGKELNEWVRHFISWQSFEVFMNTQTDRILDFPLEAETWELIKHKGFEYFARPDIEGTLPRLKTEPFYLKLSSSEQNHLAGIVANREAAKVLFVSGRAFDVFTQFQGVDVFHHLNPEQVQRFYQGFADHAYQSRLGILELKKNYDVVFRKFGIETERVILGTVAQRESSQEYSFFVERNGVDAIGMVKEARDKEALSKSFVSYVVGLKRGLIQIRADFKEAIALFGKGTAQMVDQLVLEEQLNSLREEKIDYLVFRANNGFASIQSLIEDNYVLFLYRFLLLPYADLVADAYVEDRKTLKIGYKDIQSALRTRWEGVFLKDVLAKDSAGFLASMTGVQPYFTPHEWTKKAVSETATLTVKDIITDYQPLFKAKVLTAIDGDLQKRFEKEIETIKEWTTFIDTYGTFVLEVFKAPKITALVRQFIYNHAESYLKNIYDSTIRPSVVAIQDQSLATAWEPLLTEKRAERANTLKTHAEWSMTIETKRNEDIAVRQERGRAAIADVKKLIDLPAAQQRKEQAEKKWARTKSAYEGLSREVSQTGERLYQITESILTKEGLLLQLRQRLQQLQAHAPHQNHHVHAVHAQAVQADLQAAEAALQHFPQIQQLQKELATARKEEKELQQKVEQIQSLDNEWHRLNREVNDEDFLERKKELQALISGPAPIVTGLDAAKKAKEKTAEAPQTLKKMEENERRFKEVDKLVKQPDHSLQPVKEQLAKVQATLVEKQKQADVMTQTLSINFNIEGRRAAATTASQSAHQWKELAAQVQFTSQEIGVLEKEVEALKLEKSHQTCRDEEKRRQLSVLSRQLGEEADAKQETIKKFDIASRKLTRRVQTMQEALDSDVQKMESDKKAELKGIESRLEKELLQILNSLKAGILE